MIYRSFEKRINDWRVTISEPAPRWVRIHLKDVALPSVKIEDAEDLVYALQDLIRRAQADDRGERE